MRFFHHKKDLKRWKPLLFVGVVSLMLGTTYVIKEGDLEVGRWVEADGSDRVEIIQNEAQQPKASEEELLSLDESAVANLPVKGLVESEPKSAQEKSSKTLIDAMQAVGFIKAIDSQGRTRVGSGAIINRSGTMLTNAHVVYGAKDIKVILFDPKATGARAPREYGARVIKVNRYYDLAIIDIHADTTHYLTLADEKSIRVGQDVRAIGNPLGLQVTVSRGIISAVRSNKSMGVPYIKIPGEYIAQRRFENILWVQTDAAINPGNSGGPLLNDQFEIVGINTYGYMMYEGLKFALFLKHIKEFASGYMAK